MTFSPGGCRSKFSLNFLLLVPLLPRSTGPATSKYPQFSECRVYTCPCTAGGHQFRRMPPTVNFPWTSLCLFLLSSMVQWPATRQQISHFQIFSSVWLYTCTLYSRWPSVHEDAPLPEATAVNFPWTSLCWLLLSPTVHWTTKQGLLDMQQLETIEEEKNTPFFL